LLKKNKEMAKYIIDINERSERGRAFITLLKNEASAKVQPLEEYQSKEEQIIMKAIRKAEKSKMLSYEEGNKEFEKLRKRLAR
jgi:hypothetical protein